MKCLELYVIKKLGKKFRKNHCIPCPGNERGKKSIYFNRKQAYIKWTFDPLQEVVTWPYIGRLKYTIYGGTKRDWNTQGDHGFGVFQSPAFFLH